MSKIAYILSDNRSGSTLLDQLLGAHPKVISLGEVHHLKAYALRDRRFYDPVHPLDCSCGRSIDECPFWTSAAKQLGRPFEKLQLNILMAAGRNAGRRSLLDRSINRMLRKWPRLMLRPLAFRSVAADRVGLDSFALFDAITEVTGAECLVDSSKSAYRFRALYEYAPTRVYGVHLVRDYRGTVYSKMKRGKTMEVAAREWAARIHQTRSLTKGIPEAQIFRLRYEDLCRDPRRELMRICSFLDLDFLDTMLSRPLDEVHHLGGSPSKFDPAKKIIRLDESFREAFTEKDTASMRRIIGDAAVEFGYD